MSKKTGAADSAPKNLIIIQDDKIAVHKGGKAPPHCR
jgi:hypothetical protein